MSDYFICPHCGAEVPADALACPECGSDDETGWSENAAYGDLFPYDDEIETTPPTSAPWTKYLIAVLAALMLSAFLAYGLTWHILIPLVFLAVGIAYYVSQTGPKTRHSMEKQLYRSLLQKARGDEELVERLLEHERHRSPDADRLELLQDAVYRWERDNR
jgi:hypothetical protein